MNARNLFTVYRKELRDMLRDRRTLISMIVVPTLLIPGIMLIAGVVSYRIMRAARKEIPTVMILGGADSPAVRKALAADPRIHLVRATSDWRRRIIDKRLRAAVDIPSDFDAALAHDRPATLKIYDYESEMRSGFAVAELRRFFTDYRDRVIAARLKGHGLPADLVQPFTVRTQNVAPPERVGGNIIGGLIPYILLLLCVTGAMYPAMDLTAGEKERGTLETILCSPVGRLNLVLGKFLMVLTASLATVAWSLVSTGLTLVIAGGLLAHGAGRTLAMIPTLDPWGLLAVLGLVVPVAVLFSALLLAVSLAAKTMKEAQSYVSPFIFVIIVPAMMGMLPGVELNTRLALVPILNIALAAKELVSGVYHWGHLALIFGSTSLYAAAALAWCVRLFNREQVLFRI